MRPLSAQKSEQEALEAFDRELIREDHHSTRMRDAQVRLRAAVAGIVYRAQEDRLRVQELVDAAHDLGRLRGAEDARYTLHGLLLGLSGEDMPEERGRA